jgi:hypothetical protein
LRLRPHLSLKIRRYETEKSERDREMQLPHWLTFSCA